MTAFERADYARSLLANEVFRKAYADIHADMVNALETLPIGDILAQQSAILSLQCLKLLKSRLERYVQDGISEEAKVKAEQALTSRRESLDTSKFGAIRSLLKRT